MDSIYANLYEQKKCFYIRKEFNSHRVVLVHQHGGDDSMAKGKLVFLVGKQAKGV